MSGEQTIVVEPHNWPLVDAIRTVLATPGLPPVALIGGLAVAVRVGATGTMHRATTDVDFVTGEPTADELALVAAVPGATPTVLTVGGVSVDLIVTHAIDEDDLDGLDDDQRLFVVGHRWAYEESSRLRLATAGTAFVDVRVATPAGLVATKSHAVGFPNSRRRATKLPSDLLDLYRLVDAYDTDRELAAELRAGSGALARIIADVADRAILDNPARAVRQMAMTSPTPIETDRVRDVMQTFVDRLRG